MGCKKAMKKFERHMFLVSGDFGGAENRGQGGTLLLGVEAGTQELRPAAASLAKLKARHTPSLGLSFPLPS